MRKSARLHPVVHAQGIVGGSTMCGERGLAHYRTVFNFSMVTCKRCLKHLGKLTPIDQKREELDEVFKAPKRSGARKFRPTRAHMAAAMEASGKPCVQDAPQPIADYEEVLADKRRLTRELDIAMHGEKGAAKQASLVDLIEPARRLRRVLLIADELCKAMRVYDTAVEDHRAASSIFKDLSQAVDIAMCRVRK